MSYDFSVTNFSAATVQCGNLALPTTDGAANSLVASDGAGSLSMITNNYVAGPASSVNTQIPIFSGTSGKLVTNSTATMTAGGVATFNGLSAGAVTYATTDGTSGQVLTTNGSGVASFQTIPPGSGQSSAFAEVIALYNSNIGVGDHIKFNTAGYALGGAITVDTTTAYVNTANTASLGRATVAGGKTYLLCGVIPSMKFSAGVGHSGSLTLQWFNADTTTAIGNPFIFLGDGALSPDFCTPIVKAYFAPAASPSTVRVELRITAVTGLASITRAYLEIAQVPY